MCYFDDNNNNSNNEYYYYNSSVLCSHIANQFAYSNKGSAAAVFLLAHAPLATMVKVRARSRCVATRWRSPPDQVKRLRRINHCEKLFLNSVINEFFTAYLLGFMIRWILH